PAMARTSPIDAWIGAPPLGPELLPNGAPVSAPMTGLEICCSDPSSAMMPRVAFAWKPVGQPVLVIHPGMTLEAPWSGDRVRLPGSDPTGGSWTFACAAPGASSAAPMVAAPIKPAIAAERFRWIAFIEVYP